MGEELIAGDDLNTSSVYLSSDPLYTFTVLRISESVYSFLSCPFHVCDVAEILIRIYLLLGLFKEALS